MREGLCEKTGVSWKSNGMRHSFASYHLATHEDAARTSLALGHNSPALVFRHYRELVSRKDAQEFWNLLPPPREDSGKVVAFAS
jgi:hypothetical protein